MIEYPSPKPKDETRYSVPTRIVVVSDTHCHLWTELHPDIRKAIAEADIAVHCGDFTRMDVAEGLRRSARKAVLVHGNSDPPDVRHAIPYVEVIEVEGRRIGVTHPAWGGPEFELQELLPDFTESVDAILFGHIHEPINETRDGILFLNPGQGYASFMVPATIALLTIDRGQVTSEIVVVQPAN